MLSGSEDRNTLVGRLVFLNIGCTLALAGSYLESTAVQVTSPDIFAEEDLGWLILSVLF